MAFLLATAILESVNPTKCRIHDFISKEIQGDIKSTSNDEWAPYKNEPLLVEVRIPSTLHKKGDRILTSFHVSKQNHETGVEHFSCLYQACFQTVLVCNCAATDPINQAHVKYPEEGVSHANENTQDKADPPATKI